MTTKSPEAKTANPAYHQAYLRFHRKGGRTTEPILGVQRRLQALTAIGYSIPDLMEATGLSRTTIREVRSGMQGDGGERRYIDKLRAKRIKDAYSRLSVQPCHSEGAYKAKRWAMKHKWAPPMAWDDIDDPACTPKGVSWLHLTRCQYPDSKSRYSPHGKPLCGAKGQLRKGFCAKHYMYLKRKGLL